MGGEKYKQNVYIEQQILILTHFVKETYALYEYMPFKNNTIQFFNLCTVMVGLKSYI